VYVLTNTAAALVRVTVVVCDIQWHGCFELLLTVTMEIFEPLWVINCGTIDIELDF